MLELRPNSLSNSRPVAFRTGLNAGPGADPCPGLGLGQGLGLISHSPGLHGGPTRCNTAQLLNPSTPRRSALGGSSSNLSNTSSQFHRLVLASTGTAHLFRRTSGFHAYLLDRRRPSFQPTSTNSGGDDNDDDPDDDSGSVAGIRGDGFSDLSSPLVWNAFGTRLAGGARSLRPVYRPVYRRFRAALVFFKITRHYFEIIICIYNYISNREIQYAYS